MREANLHVRTIAIGELFNTIKEELNSNKINKDDIVYSFAMSSKDKEEI